MESGIFGYIQKFSKAQQVLILLLTACSFPFLYLSYQVPKEIIDKAIGGKDPGKVQFPKDVFGYEFSQLEYLYMLCALFLALVFINGGFKYFINVYRGMIGERLLRRLRYTLLERVTRFPLLHFQNVSQGEVVSMVTKETEPLGGFMGDAISMPAFQGGTAITILFFMFLQDWVLGLAAISLYPLQMYVIPKLQRQVTAMNKQRVLRVRKLSDRVGELVSGVHEVHAHDTSQFELADFASRLGAIFNIRLQIYRKKFFIKFLNNFLDKLTPFFFYSVGGYLVIKGDLSFGSLVAILAAYKDLSAPWKELLGYYQRMEDARVRYTSLTEQFRPAGMVDAELLAPVKEHPETISGIFSAANVSLEEDEGSKVVDAASFNMEVNEHVAIMGSGGSGISELTKILARQIAPTSGKVTIDGQNIETLHEAVSGRRMAYIGPETYTHAGTIRDNLLYVLKHYPQRDEPDPTSAETAAWLKEANSSGNSNLNIDADWVDYTQIGIESPDELTQRMLDVLPNVDMEEDVFQLGLRRIINPDENPELAEEILKVRSAVREKLQDPGLAEYVEVFDASKFNNNASVAENILFGTPVGETFAIETLGKSAFVRDILEDVGLEGKFLEMGRAMAALMVELFRDLPPGHEFFERFGFIDADDLPEFQQILNHVSNLGLEFITTEHRNRLEDLPFKLIVARHHLDLIDDAMKEKILEARRLFAETISEEDEGSIAFFHEGAYNAASSVQDNILFGKVAYNKAGSASQISSLLTDVVNSMGIRPLVLVAGLDFHVGSEGKRLSVVQRQKLSIARNLLKQPQLMIVNQATAPFDAPTQSSIFETILKQFEGRGLVWVESDMGHANRFDRVLKIDHGRIEDTAPQVETPGDAAPIERADSTETPKSAEQNQGLGEETELLAAIPFFAGMDRSKLKLLAFTSERQEFSAGQILFWQGSPGSDACVIVKGTVDVNVDTEAGQKTVANPGRGDLIGELALLSDAPRTATVQAKTDVTVLSISKDVFLQLIRENSGVSANLARILAGRLVGTMRTLSGSLSLYDPETDLPKRDLFVDRVRHMALQEQRVGRSSALILVNLDELVVGIGDNETIVHTHLATEISKRLIECVRNSDTVSRLTDGYSFGIIADGTQSASNVSIVLDRLKKYLSQSYLIEGRELSLKGELKCEVYPLDEKHLGEVQNLKNRAPVPAKKPRKSLNWSLTFK
jgi:putative ABC transport system ATP-binding protein